MRLTELIKLDKKVNKNNGKGYFIAKSYRTANYLYNSTSLILRPIKWLYLKYYNFYIVGIMGIEIPYSTKIGHSMEVWHATGIVINPETIIGNNLLIRHGVTIGNKYVGSKCPNIGNNVDIGCNSIIIGDVKIGDFVTIGAGTIITKTIPSNSIVYGNPIKVIQKNDCNLQEL